MTFLFLVQFFNNEVKIVDLIPVCARSPSSKVAARALTVNPAYTSHTAHCLTNGSC